eukprot:jgi/Mesvir1/25736/Mv01918-RA.1
MEELDNKRNAELDERFAKAIPVSGPPLLRDLDDVLNKFDAITRGIPSELLRQCKAVCFCITRRLSCVLSGTWSSGFIVARVRKSEPFHQNWSGPCAVTGGGIGLGFEAGASETYRVVVILDQACLSRFIKHQVIVGVSASCALGTLGTEAEARWRLGKSRGACVSYRYPVTSSRGIVGVSVTLASLHVRYSENRDFYGREYHPRDILEGKVGMRLASITPHVSVLYKRLDQAASREDSPPDS